MRTVQIIFNEETVETIRTRNRIAHGSAYVNEHFGPGWTGPTFEDVVSTDLSEGFFTITVGKPNDITHYHYNCFDISRVKEHIIK